MKQAIGESQMYIHLFSKPVVGKEIIWSMLFTHQSPP